MYVFFSTDVQLLLLSKKEAPPEQRGSGPSLDQEDPPELLHINEEREELWTTREGEQLGGLEKAALNGDNDETSDSFELESDDNASEPQTEDSSDWEETGGPQLGLNPLQNNEVPVREEECNTGQTVSSTASFKRLNGIQAGQKLFTCSVWAKTYSWRKSLTNHVKLHSEGIRFSCSVRNKKFQWRTSLVVHMRRHTGENLFTCLVCVKNFTLKENLKQQLTLHAGEEP